MSLLSGVEWLCLLFLGVYKPNFNNKVCLCYVFLIFKTEQ